MPYLFVKLFSHVYMRWMLLKVVNPTAIVYSSREEMQIVCCKRSFQIVMKISNATTMIAGLMDGIIMLTSVRRCPAPSISAAS